MTIKYDETTKRWTLGDIAVGQLLTIVKGTALLASREDNPYEEAREVDEFFERKLYSLPEIKKRRKHFKIRAKERPTGKIVTPEFIGYKTRDEVIAFFGLEEPDIEWYTITEITEEELTTPKNNSNGTMD